MNIINKFKDKQKYLKDIGVFAFISLMITLAFIGYNMYIYFQYKSIWNISISIYYLALVLIKLISFIVKIKYESKNKEYPKSIFIVICILLLFGTLTMCFPSYLMANNLKESNIGMIPSITFALFVTCKIVYSVDRYNICRSDYNLYNYQDVLISFISVIMSILTLQNTLILANGGMNDSMIILTKCSSFILISFSFIVIVLALIKGLKKPSEDK
jgi:hypothetical protein